MSVVDMPEYNARKRNRYLEHGRLRHSLAGVRPRVHVSEHETDVGSEQVVHFVALRIVSLIVESLKAQKHRSMRG